ncbi:MAG: glycosyltransferase family 2 protein [Anaerolineae bacterium]
MMSDRASGTLNPRASVVIPNWNGMSLLRPCLDSLRRQTTRDFEVIVVDNASTDGSQAALAAEYPEVRVLAQTRNLGFAAGCNVGIAAARGDVLVMLNNDTEADPAWLAALLDALDRYPESGSAASRIMLYDNRHVLHSAGDLYQTNGLPNSRGVWQPYGPPYDVEEPVFGGCGGAVAYRRAMLDKVGLFEESFFMYCEDVDLNWRAQLAGWPCIYVPQAVIYHRLSATGGGKLASYYVGRNTIWVIARNMPAGVLKRHRRAIVAAQRAIFWDALRAWRGEAARARLRGVLAGLFTWRRWRAAREAIQASCRVSEDYVESLLVPVEN